MKFKIYLFLVKYSLFYNQYYSVSAKAFVGQNVRRANQGEFTFVVSLKAIDNENPTPECDHRCTGSLISSKDVLTVSHALEQIHLLRFEIMFGSIDLRCNLKRYPAWWINYKQWAFFYNVPFQYEEDDIALIRLTGPVPEEIIPAVLLPLTPDALYGQNITVVGWGSTSTDDYQRYLQTGVLTVIPTTECDNRVNAFYNEPEYLPDNVICGVADPFIISTPGDSGGPVIFMDVMVAVTFGITPSTLPRLHPSRVNIHLSIYEFTNFIENILELR